MLFHKSYHINYDLGIVDLENINLVLENLVGTETYPTYPFNGVMIDPAILLYLRQYRITYFKYYV